MEDGLNQLSEFVFCSGWSYLAAAMVMAMLLSLCWREANHENGFYKVFAWVAFISAGCVLSRAYYPVIVDVYAALDPTSHTPAAVREVIRGWNGFFEGALITGMGSSLLLGLYAVFAREAVCRKLEYGLDEGVVEEVVDSGSWIVSQIGPDLYQDFEFHAGHHHRSSTNSDGLMDLFSSGSSSGSSNSSSDSDGDAAHAAGGMLVLIAIAVVLIALLLAFASIFGLVWMISGWVRDSTGHRIWCAQQRAQRKTT